MATVEYSEFWGDGLSSSGNYALLRNKMPGNDRIRRVVNRAGFRVFRELLDEMIGEAVGETASATHIEVGFDNSLNKPTITTITDINRATDAADVTALKELLVNVNPRPAFPRDLSGNGGPALA